MARKQKPRQPRKHKRETTAHTSPPANEPVASEPSLLPAPAQPWWHPAAVIMLLAFVLYGQTLSYDYALDDAIVITENVYTQEGLAGLGKIFTSDAFEGYFQQKKNLVAGGRYRPLSVATFALEQEFFGDNAAFSHFNNVLLYGICGILLYFFLLALFPAEKTKPWWRSFAFLVTILFMAHPIHSEVVANIKGRDEIMALLFMLGTMLLALRYVDKQDLKALLAIGPLYLMGLLSKETALPFLLIIPMTVWFFRKAEAKQYAIVMAPILVVTAIYFALRFQFVGTGATVETYEILNDPFINASYGEQLATVSHTLGLYLVKLVAPISLSHDYYFNQIPIIGWGNVKALVPLLIYLGIGVYALLGLRKKRPVSYGILFFILSLSIVSNIFVPIGTTMGERFVFVPSLGFLLAVMVLIRELLEKRGTTTTHKFGPLAIGTAAVVLLFSVRTIARNPVWKNNFTLFTTDVENSPNSAKLQTAAGGALVEEAEVTTNLAKKNEYLTRAITHLTRALDIYPAHGNAWLLLGNAHFNYNDNYPKAMECFQTALRYRPGMLDAYQNAAVTATKMKRYDLASAYYKKVSARRPTNVDLWYRRGMNYEEWGKPDSAIYAYAEAIRLDPQHYNALGKTGMVYGKYYNNLDKAIEFARRAIAIQPAEGWLHENLGIALAMKGDPNAAIAAFNEGLRHDPNNGKLYVNMGITYQNMGNAAKAQEMFTRAQQLGASPN